MHKLAYSKIQRHTNPNGESCAFQRGTCYTGTWLRFEGIANLHRNTAVV